MHKFKLLLCVLLCSLAGYAQDSAAAEAAFKAQQWDKAAAEYTKIAAAHPGDGHAWYQLAMSLYSAGRFAEAAPAFEHAAGLKFLPVISTYNAAAALARAGRREEALARLENLPGLGYRAARQVEQDEDFASLRKEPRFQGVLVALRNNAAPCEHAAVNRQFDFWVGEWDVQTPQGQHAGDSSVQKILGGCVVLENWSGSGSQGKSVNIYNPALKNWQQFWVDDAGRATLYTGALAGDEMRYVAEAGEQNGPVARKMTFTPLGPDKVRQLGEMSTDGGKTWTVSYDLIYVRKK
ncbi:MAG TPA: bacterial transcriptional activator domain-containing protein [Candidatus Limnocylindrales bacterium]|nr:bacterial transcriptional activator domain-containing protein [Candidatus Limnocylindrales bacterium]